MTKMIPNKHVFKYETPTRELTIEKYTSILPINRIYCDKLKFSKLCEQGCINFNQKYSCPPHSPSFKRYSNGATQLKVIYYQLHLNQYQELTPYNRVRASNSVLKSLLDRELLTFREQGYTIVGSGSCRACKPCGAKEGVRCKKPEKIIYSLESLGVDVTHLVNCCFGFDLQWYKKGFSQDFTSVVGGILR
jgi:predicted metal-binding protein